MSSEDKHTDASGYLKHCQSNGSSVASRTPSRPAVKPSRTVTHAATCTRCTSKTWMDFTQTTSLHGFRYIWDIDTFTIRRIIWLVLVLGGIGLMTFHILDRVLYFVDWPVTVNLHVNFNKSLLFPAVTFCNQNAFRSSVTAKNGRYDLITNMYQHFNNFSLEELHRLNGTDILLDDLYLTSSHRVEDLIVRCKWRGEECDKRNFTMFLSERGVCFTFNGAGQQDTRQRTVNSVGSENGLTLTLNIEDYEYMSGPNDASGIKLLVHDQKQYPKVHELGIALSVGLQSFVGLQFISVRNLPRPHGHCEEPKLKYFTYYSPDNCQIDCFTDIVISACSCRLQYMPYNHESQRVCTLEEYYTCYLPRKDQFLSEMHESCYCPVSCDFKIFDPALSYSSLSTMVTSRLLHGVNETELTSKYNHAREITHRLQRDYAVPFHRKLSALKQKYDELKSVVLNDISKHLNDQKEAILKVFTEADDAEKKTRHLYHFRKFIVRKNFVRAGTAMEERSFLSVTNDMQQFVYHAIELVNVVAKKDTISPSTRESVFLFLETLLHAKIRMCDNAISNYTEFYEAYENGTPIFNYKYLNKVDSEREAIIPKILMEKALHHTMLVRHRTLKIGNELSQIKAYLTEMLTMASSAFYNSSLNSTQFHLATVQYLYWCRQFLQSKNHLLKDAAYWPINEMSKQENQLKLINNKIISLKNGILTSLLSLSHNLNSVETLFLKRIEKGIAMSEQYLADGSVNKLDIAKFLVSDEIKTGSNSLTVLFDEIRIRGQNIYDNWGDILHIVKSLWKLVLSDDDMKSYYVLKNMTKYLQDFDNVSRVLTEEYEGFRDKLDLRLILQHIDDDFLRALKIVIDNLDEFLDSQNIDRHFVRSNFLLVNLYYKELNYEQITQQKAYDSFALLCDIGGSMGLFIGASVMTVFEVLDLLINSFFVNIFRRPGVAVSKV